MIDKYGIASGLWCIAMDIHIYICYTIVSQPELFVFLVEEADIEDEQGNITKELYVLQVAPLESHARYRLETEDARSITCTVPQQYSATCNGNKTCTICQHICSSTQALKVHIRGQHMDDPSLQCDYTAGDKYGLDLHRHSHLTPESRYQCDQCPKSYSQKWHLKQRQQEHQGRFSSCSHCRVTFMQKSGLVAHIPRCPSQEGGAPEKQHSCKICGRKYSRKGELTHHLKIKH